MIRSSNSGCFGFVASSLVLAALAFAATPAAAQKALQKVKLGQVTSTSLTFAPVFAAQELGFFEEEGIELEHLNFKGGSVLQPQIASKQVTFGFTAVETVILSRQPGKDPLPLVFFYNAARGSIWETVVLDSSPIKTLADLKGKKIGIGATANANVPLTRAMLHDIGLEMTKDYSFLPIGVGAPAFRAMTNGDADAYNTFDSNIATFETTGAKLRTLDIPQKYKNLFSNGFVAHQDTLRENPKLVIGFGRAFTKGVIVCEANPEFCVMNFWKHNPTAKPKAANEQDVLKAGLHILHSRMKSYTYFPGGTKREFGAYPDNVWRDYVEILFAGGELSTKDIDLKPIYSNQFVKDFNDFDVVAIQKKAKQLK
ncbi:MAG: ABC transporter substrate-binding protein [Xanthobacteraceae bacterium]